MRRWVWVVAIGLGAVAAPGMAQDIGPGAGGATLRLPGMDAPAVPTPVPGLPPGLQNAWNPAAGAPRVAVPPSNRVDINKDITITPEVGPWTILVMSYTTPRDNPGLDAAQMAREFVTEWNTNPNYAKFKLKAHVFNFGAEEKQQEYERVQKVRQKQIEELTKLGVDGRTMPIRIPTIHIDEHTAVLLGGFKDADAAAEVVQKIRKLPTPDPNRVKLDRLLGAIYEPDQPMRGGSVLAHGDQYSNPFAKAMPVRNPTAARGNFGMSPAEELKYLRGINSKETLSLLAAKKPFTLCVKQYNSQYKATTDEKDAERFVNQLLSTSKRSGEWKDYAYQNAHNLADGLRKAQLEAYVLHCQCCSYVTVGNYATPQDPELVQMQRFLETYFKNPNLQVLDMFERPVPMKVPGF